MHMDGKICVIYVKNLFGCFLFSEFWNRIKKRELKNRGRKTNNYGHPKEMLELSMFYENLKNIFKK